MKNSLPLIFGALIGAQTLGAQTPAPNTPPATNSSENAQAPSNAGANSSGLSPTASTLGYMSIGGKVYSLSSEKKLIPLTGPVTFPHYKVTPEGVIGQTGEAQNVPDGALLTSGGQLMAAPSGLSDAAGQAISTPAYDPAHGAANFNGGISLAPSTNSSGGSNGNGGSAQSGGASQSSNGNAPGSASTATGGSNNAGNSPSNGGAQSNGNTANTGNGSNTTSNNGAVNNGTSAVMPAGTAGVGGQQAPLQNTGTTAVGQPAPPPQPGRTASGGFKTSVPATNTNGSANPTGVVTGSGSSATTATASQIQGGTGNGASNTGSTSGTGGTTGAQGAKGSGTSGGGSAGGTGGGGK